MQQNNTKYKTINRLNTDFRAEVVAAGLIESGQDAEKVLIVREKGDKRHISKDIAKVKNEFSKHDLMEYLYIYTNRSGIYESIPENIFHQPFSTAQRKGSKEAVIEEMRKNRNEEMYARRYFQPFEMVIDQLLIDAQIYEREFDKKNFHSNLKDILVGFWSVLRFMTLKQAVFFIKTIPVLNHITADFDTAGKLMGIVLDSPVKIELGDVSEIQTNLSAKIGKENWRLGTDAVLGSSFKDNEEDLVVTVGPACPKALKALINGSNNQFILEQLLVMMLPANRKKRVKYKVKDELAKFRLSDDTHKAYLGINTRL